jgi:hypothetical protein
MILKTSWKVLENFLPIVLKFDKLKNIGNFSRLRELLESSLCKVGLILEMPTIEGITQCKNRWIFFF